MVMNEAADWMRLARAALYGTPRDRRVWSIANDRPIGTIVTIGAASERNAYGPTILGQRRLDRSPTKLTFGNDGTVIDAVERFLLRREG